jgi:hypothetical protein
VIGSLWKLVPLIILIYFKQLGYYNIQESPIHVLFPTHSATYVACSLLRATNVLHLDPV